MMQTHTYLILLLSLTITATYPAKAQEKTTGKSLKEGLFQLNEIDMHVHAGKERPLPLNEWIDLFVRDGRKVMLLLDHLELYRMDDKKNKEWIKKNNFNDWYPNTKTGKYDFIKDISTVESRNDVLTFRGWEIWEGEIEEGLDKQPIYWDDPIVREAFIADIRPLVEDGVKFTISTDAHGTGSFNESYTPELYCKDLGITPENVNTIIRELLVIRAKKNIR